LFLLVMPRWAPWLVGLVRSAALALGAARWAAVRAAREALRTLPAASFLAVPFFTR
jgi:hypothetical protein